MEITFIPPNTIRARLTLTDFDDSSITNCSTHAITVTDPLAASHSTYDADDVTNNEDGTYDLYVPIAADDELGVYTLKWTITHGSKLSSDEVKFKVE